MKKLAFISLACAFASTTFAAGAEKVIGQHVTAVQANESRVIYLYDVAATHPSCSPHKRATAFYVTGAQSEELADGCWITEGDKVTFRLYAPSGMALVTDVPKKEIKFK